MNRNTDRNSHNQSSRRRAHTARNRASQSQPMLNSRDSRNQHGRTIKQKRRSKKKSSTGKAIVIVGMLIVAIICGAAYGIKALSSSSQKEVTEVDAMEVGASLAPTEATITFTGDCILGRDKAANYDTSLDAKYEEVKDYGYFFKNFKEIFSSDDLTVVDFEGTLTESTDYVEKEFNFKGPKEYVNILLEGDVECATLANNHSHDYGSAGYSDTENALEEAGIQTFGYEKIAYVEVNGIKVGLIGTYAFGADGVESEMVSSIKEAKNNGSEAVVVYAHWGEEKSYTPNSYQVGLGRAAIDAGADLVVGTHPHVLQGYEKYKDHYIVYSLGNFCFGGNVHPYDMDCYVLQWTFSRVGDAISPGEIKIIPTQVSSQTSYNDYQPIVLSDSDYDRVMKKVEESNSRIASM